MGIISQVYMYVVAMSLTAAADSLDDGPHVYWQSDSTAIVFYLCDGEVAKQAFQVADTLRFGGFCTDTKIQYLIPARASEIEPYLFDDVSRILTISDIHGEYEYLIDFLQTAGVVDKGLHWSWGNGHLVVNGDTFDRGDMVTECLWLFYRLEQEAKAVGGRVHFLLGNHELMVMLGDNRYVNKKYTDGIARRTRIKHEDLYGPQMELGRWLRSKHTTIMVNDILFVHGGMPPEAVERGLSLEDINETLRRTADLRSYEIAFSDTERFLLRGEGPLWFRDYHRDKEGTSREQIEAILDTYDAEAIVVGHSEHEQVEAIYDGLVFRIDVPVKALDSFQGLLWEDGRFYRVTGTGDLEPIG
ncbi:MAG: hypothetical protein AMS21_12730 [Gemmatimonas sp. SG8_38_2]|nr:MAG: hypothetical protein AMS21_12730 [Gemmatimonas sp. SG8_38_2]